MAADEAESGYWDMMYLLYPEMAEAAGMGVLHDLVSSWPLIERSLAVRPRPGESVVLRPYPNPHCLQEHSIVLLSEGLVSTI